MQLLLASEGTGIAPTPDAPWLAWVVFGVVFVAINVVDAVFVNGGDKEPTPRKAGLMTGLYIFIGVLFGIYLLLTTDMGSTGVAQWYASFVSEWALSLDNLFVMAMIIASFAIPREYTFRVVFWGVAFAMLLRAVFIILGVQAIQHFAWLLAVFGALLLFSAYRMAKESFDEWRNRRNGIVEEEEETKPEDRRSYRFFSRFIPSTPRLHGHAFFAVIDGKRLATPLFFTLLTIGTVDIVFTLDSIPVVLSITDHTFTAITSNMFAVCGLRTAFFLLTFLAKRFSRLADGMIALLAFIGVKLIIGDEWLMHLVGLEPVEFPLAIGLGVIGGIVALSIIASLVFPKKTDDTVEGDEMLEKIEELTNPHEVMVEVGVDTHSTMEDEFADGLVHRYLNEAIEACGRYDSDGQVPVSFYGNGIVELETATVGSDYDIAAPSFSEGSDLSQLLRHARETAKRTNGTYIFVVLTDGRVGDEEEIKVRQPFASMPDNAFVLFVRVSNQPGGTEFLQGLDDFNVGEKDRCDTVFATDDNGQPLENISEVIGREIDAFLAKRREAILQSA